MASKNQVTNPKYGKSKTGTFRPVGGRGVGLGALPNAGRTAKGYKGWEWDALSTAATLVLSAFPAASIARGATIASKAAKAENIPVSQVLKTMTRNTARGITTRGGSGVGKTTRATGSTARTGGTAAKTTKATAPKGNQYPNLPRTGRKTATGKPYTTAEMRTVAAASKGNYRLAAGAAAVGGVLALGKIPVSSATAPRQKYSGMKPGAEKVRTGPGGAYVGSGMGAKARPQAGGGAYVGSTVGGNTGSRKTPAAPSGPSGGGGGRPRQAGPSKKQVQARRAAITDLLSKAETAAAAGNIQAAANFSAAALNRQKAGKGTAASMKRVTKVAQAYSTAAGRKKIENQEAGRTRLGKPPVKGKKG